MEGGEYNRDEYLLANISYIKIILRIFIFYVLKTLPTYIETRLPKIMVVISHLNIHLD